MFRVEWLAEAQAELTTIDFESSPEARRTITEASRALDEELQANPDRVGKSRGNRQVRIVFAGLLAAKIHIDREVQMVFVVDV